MSRSPYRNEKEKENARIFLKGTVLTTMTQVSLGQMVGIKSATISQMASGKRGVSAFLLECLMKRYTMTKEEILSPTVPHKTIETGSEVRHIRPLGEEASHSSIRLSEMRGYYNTEKKIRALDIVPRNGDFWLWVRDTTFPTSFKDGANLRNVITVVTLLDAQMPHTDALSKDVEKVFNPGSEDASVPSNVKSAII